MASHPLIDTHRTQLARRLPAAVVDELADGLTQTWHRHLATGRPPADAARAAIAEFGTVDQVTDAFVTNCPGRRTARILLASGPLAGVCWGASLITARAWQWPIPGPAAAATAVATLAVVATLITSATSRRSYRRARLGTPASIGLAALDLTMLAAVILIAPTTVWPMLVAVPVSLARIGLTLQSLPLPHPR